jgi:hypothetical protein
MALPQFSRAASPHIVTPWRRAAVPFSVRPQMLCHARDRAALGAGDGGREMHAKAKTPARCGLAGVLYARTPHKALGIGGLESARHLLTLSRMAFGICIK